MGDKVGWPLGTILAHSYYTDGMPAAELDLLLGVVSCLLGVARHCSRGLAGTLGESATGYNKHIDETAVGTHCTGEKNLSFCGSIYSKVPTTLSL